MTTEVLTRLEQARKELLDLGLRNPLINHRRRAKQVRVVDEISVEVFRLLVTTSKSMSFEALPDEKVTALIQQEPSQVATDDVDWKGLLAQPDDSPDDGPAGRHTDKKLQTDMSSDKLQKRLISIHRDAKTYIEEQGVNILFLAVGFLCWYEATSSPEPRRAPLILIPVELVRKSARERFHVNWTGDDIGDNLSLAEKLRTEFGIKSPPITNSDEINVAEYFNNVGEAIGGAPRWKVEPDEIVLGFFSFGKFLMYKDLAGNNWPEESGPGDHEVLSALLSDGFVGQESLFGDEDHIDTHVSPADAHQIVDADSSQTLAILDVNSGRNMVLQGPPGTGKSQTITNIIAEAIGNQRKVLFVSEKMAALEVVKRRLDLTGLGDAVLELHSHKTNKKRLLEELDRTLHQGRPLFDDPTDDIDTLKLIRNRLNAHCEAVNSVIGETRTTFVRALGLALKAANPKLPEPFLDLELLRGWTEAQYRENRMAAAGLDQHLAEHGAPAKSTFGASRLSDFLPSQQTAVEKMIAAAGNATTSIIETSQQLADAIGLGTPITLADAKKLSYASLHAVKAPNLDGIPIDAGKWRTQSEEIRLLVNAGQRLAQLHNDYDCWLLDASWEQNVITLRQDYMDLGGKWWRFLSGRFRSSKSRLQGLCVQPVPRGQKQCLGIIDAVLESQKQEKVYAEHTTIGEEAFGVQWKQKRSDWDDLQALTDWLLLTRDGMSEGLFPSDLVACLSKSPDLIRIKKLATSLQQAIDRHSSTIATLSDRLKLEASEPQEPDGGLTLESQAGRLQHWHDCLGDLYAVVRFNQIGDELRGKDLGQLSEAARNWEHPDDGSLLRMFDYSWFTSLVERAYQDNELIRLFDRAKQERTLAEFSRLDKLLFEHNQARLALAHWQSLPKLSGGGELNIIRREINKKRRHLPIRKLMNEAGRAIQAIKPVFMMSPMSIATFIAPGDIHFDLVVFDEASQVKPVDAFGAILRGDQTVVVGDSKQLPPTNFFDSVSGEDEEQVEESVGDMESILSLFAGKGALERMLRWHYRSRHESLIAVSNNEFYDNRLVVFPSPGANPKARGLSLHHLPHTTYDRGRTRTNPEEAAAVAEAVMKHARTYPDMSLGVVAFSVAQRDAVEMQLELKRREDPSCEAFLREDNLEPFFVKNLENVQGDERDVIFISIGYGRTAEGYLPMSFGPLNREGGERRLNVLISRARLAMDVFTNFTASDLDLSRTNARGVVSLRNFLAYADNRQLEVPYSTGREPDSPFEESVMKALKSHGIEIEGQVGTAGFFIDIAVKDPEKPGRYILGIECDGASYHSARSARDRDRLRQEVLENLGWRFHRIWSTDWYRNPKGELERALTAIDRAKTSPQNKPAPTAGTPTADGPSKHMIERAEETRQELTSETASSTYQRASLSIRLFNRELHELSASELLPHIESVVEAESPIHRMEVVRRITESAGLKRSGNRIQNTVGAAIRVAVSQKLIAQRGSFLWATTMGQPLVRDRSSLGSAAKKLEWVAPEEIAESLIQEVESAFSVSCEDAVQGAARRLGFFRMGTASKRQIEGVLKKMILEGRIQEKDSRVSIRRNRLGEP